MPARPARLTSGLIVLLAAIGALGSMAIHMFVPAMPDAVRDLHTAPTAVQLSVTLYLVGLGSGQLVAGPAADRLGRRPVLLAGLALFVLGAIGCALARDVELLLAARLVQAVGGAAAIVSVRTVVSDLSERHEVAGKMAALTSVLLVSPALAPVIGGVIAVAAGWRAIFVLLAVGGALGFLAFFLRIGETRPPRAEAHAARLIDDYRRLLRNARFRRYALAIAASSCALYIFLSASSFLLIDRYGLGPEQAGLCYFLVAGAGITGTTLVGRLERRGGAFKLGVGGAAAGAGLMLALALAGFDGPVALMGPMILVGLGTGIAAPSGVAGAMHAEAGLAGTAASLAGALQMVASGLTTSAIAQLHLSTLPALAGAVFGAALLGFFFAPGGRAV